MKLSTKLAALTPVTVGLLGLTELHYLIRHFATIAEAAAAVTVGAAVWIRMGRKAENASERAAEPVTESYTVRSLPQARPVSYPMSEEVSRHIAR